MKPNPLPSRRHLVFGLAVLSFLVIVSMTAAAANQARAPICAIDMGSNSFRRIAGSFEKGRYEQRNIEKRTLGVGDDVALHGRISDPKLAEINCRGCGSACVYRDSTQCAHVRQIPSQSQFNE